MVKKQIRMYVGCGGYTMLVNVDEGDVSLQDNSQIVVYQEPKKEEIDAIPSKLEKLIRK